MKHRIYTPLDYTSMPWKNGRGSTLELAKETLGTSGEFLWRLSIAGVVENGAFSDFSGYDRTLLLLTGKGITLKGASGLVNRLEQRLDAARFSGDDSTEAELHDGEITDFNIMTKRDCCTASVQTFVAPVQASIAVSGGDALVYAVDGPVTIDMNGAARIELLPRHLFHASNPDPGFIRLTGSATICVQISSANT